jgi:hypothetical protein
MGRGSRYLRVAGRHREEAAPVVGFRFRYPRAVEYGGTVGAAGAIGRTEAPILVRDFGGRGRIVARRLSLGARIRRQARAPQAVRPCGRWGLTAQRRASKGGHHAINTEVRLGRPRQSKSARYKMGWRAAVHSDRDRLDLLDRFVESRLHARTWRPTVTGR